MSSLDAYIPMVMFMSDFLGSKAEVLLCDTFEKKIIYVLNALTTDSVIGKSIGDLEQKYINAGLYLKKDFIGNYKSFSSNKQKLRSSAYFIKNEKGELIGLIVINLVVDQLIEFRDLIEKYINGESVEERHTEENSFYECFEFSFEDMMSATINDALKLFSVPPERLSLDERKELIRILDKKGTFLIKGSIGALAKLLNTTETTIYRYINGM